MPDRIVDFAHITSERVILESHVKDKTKLDTDVQMVAGRQSLKNQVSEDTLGAFRPPAARKAVIADMALLDAFQANKLPMPAFLEAGPRSELRYDPLKVHAAIVTSGGLAPGINCVVHSIVKRHCDIYESGHIYGVYDSFRGLCNLADNLVPLNPTITEEWLDHGGSGLGMVRYYHDGNTDTSDMVQIITENLENNLIDILYVIGGDGSLKVAHQIALANPTRSVVGIPKTMDNDILWVWQSFGFDTAVEQATRVINTLHDEARSTRRICLIELFGAESGFVAANASIASGRVDLVLVPEVFAMLTPGQAETYLDATVRHIGQIVKSKPHSPHAVVVVAEGVGTVLEKKGVSLDDVPVRKDTFVTQLRDILSNKVLDAHGRKISVFFNQPRHYIRAVPANSHDQIYCERLGALAVDNALAGYSDFMISQWATEFVLVPLALVQDEKKSIPIHGMFWKQVVSSTGQPLSPAEQGPVG